MDNPSMEGQVVVVTGAGGGIGSVICCRLAEAGAKVVLADIKESSEMQKVTAPAANCWRTGLQKCMAR